MSIRSAFAGGLAAIGMRLGVVVMPVAGVVRVAVAAAVLMMPERHALTGRHRCHALEGNGKDD